MAVAVGVCNYRYSHCNSIPHTDIPLLINRRLLIIGTSALTSHPNETKCLVAAVTLSNTSP